MGEINAPTTLPETDEQAPPAAPSTVILRPDPVETYPTPVSVGGEEPYGQSGV